MADEAFTDPVVGNPIGTESSLSNWVGPYVTDMLGKGQALSEQPYQAYTGPLTAGTSPLQNQAFQGIANLTVPTGMGDAANTAGQVADQFGNMSYSQQQFGNQYTAPQNLFSASDITTQQFDNNAAQQYMNPYLQQSLDPQLAEARRQAEIQRIQEAGRLTQAGAYGGSRQAIMESEGNRNLATELAAITGRGYDQAYQQAGQMFTSDQARALQAQQATQMGQINEGQQALTNAQYGAQYGLSADQINQRENQFGAQYGLDALSNQLGAAQAQGALGRSEFMSSMDLAQQQSGLGAIQRGIESEGINADRAQFEQERDYPYEQVRFQQSLLQGLPLEAQSTTYGQPSFLSQFAAGSGGIMDLLGQFGIGGTTDSTANTGLGTVAYDGGSYDPFDASNYS